MKDVKGVEELLSEFGRPAEPLPPAPAWHVDDVNNCGYGWTDGTTWGKCDCEDPANPWPAREPGDGPRDCACFGCNGHEPRWERGKISGCEHKDHHCEWCHELGHCTAIECTVTEE